MDRYTIYCTSEQTNKALELGAPIKVHDTYIQTYKTHEYWSTVADKIKPVSQYLNGEEGD